MVDIELIKGYFRMGLSYPEIVTMLFEVHGVSVSVRHLKRILKRNNLARRKNYTRLEPVVDFIESELGKSGRNHGYRWMHLKCIQNGLVVKRETIRVILGALDPEDVELRAIHRLRRRRYLCNGPNFQWHIDGYDKLKPYGICIHGCIDGFSRKIIWLKASYTNNDPTVIAGYYVEAVASLSGCPVRVRGDHGTENGHIEVFQKFLRHNDNAFLYGTSQLNQRIEAWWCILRKETGQFWMDLFQILAHDGVYSGTFLDKNLVQFCFMRLIQVCCTLLSRENRDIVITSVRQQDFSIIIEWIFLKFGEQRDSDRIESGSQAP